MIDVLAWIGFALGIASKIVGAIGSLRRNNLADHSTQFYFVVGALWLAANVWIVWSCFHLLRFR